VAPIVLEEAVGDWFLANRPSPYMLEVFDVRAAQASRIPAALHLDGTARAQTISRDQDPVIYDLIKAFGKRTGIPMLCNTSLNDRGEPIVANAAQALNFCVRKRIGVLYLNDLRVRLRTDTGLPPSRLAGPQPRDRQAFADQATQREQLWNEWIARGLSPDDLFTCVDSPQLRPRIGTPSATDAAQLRRTVSAILRLNPRQALRVRSLADKYGPPIT
jgi:carbamoyltransferase